VRRAAVIRQREQADRDLILAWHVEYIRLKTQNDKRMPTLQMLLARGKWRQTPTEQLAQVRILSEHYGIPLRTKTA
jgi:hypothetical protein